jgi:hypothetical protein
LLPPVDAHPQFINHRIDVSDTLTGTTTFDGGSFNTQVVVASKHNGKVHFIESNNLNGKASFNTLKAHVGDFGGEIKFVGGKNTINTAELKVCGKNKGNIDQSQSKRGSINLVILEDC